MAIFRTKDYVPSVYVSESRDFQLFLKVLDFVQNSIKYDIDTMVCSLSTEDTPGNYLERLKSKLGFYTTHNYDDESLRLALKVFPFIIRYKGSKEGIKRCVIAYLRHIGVRGNVKLDIYNEKTSEDVGYEYTVRIGIPTNITDTTLLMELLSYILPTGYFVEIYFYKDVNFNPTDSISVSDFKPFNVEAKDNAIIRVNMSDTLENETVSTTQLGMVYTPEKESLT